MRKWITRAVALVVLPLAVFFWHANWAAIYAEINPLIVQTQKKITEFRVRRAISKAYAMNPVAALVRDEAQRGEVGELSWNDPNVQLTLLLTQSLYNLHFNRTGNRHVLWFPANTHWLVVTGQSALTLSRATGSYGLTAGSVSVIFVLPDDDPMLILSHESVHLLQYSQYGPIMEYLPKQSMEYEAEFISVRVTQLLHKAIGANEIRVSVAEIPDGGIKVDKMIFIGVLIAIAVVCFFAWKKYGKKAEDVMAKAGMAEEGVKDEVKKAEVKVLDVTKKAEEKLGFKKDEGKDKGEAK